MLLTFLLKEDYQQDQPPVSTPSTHTFSEKEKAKLEKLLENKCYIGIATHDEQLVWSALAIIDKLGLKKEEYEFQMLLGVTEELMDFITNS